MAELCREHQLSAKMDRMVGNLTMELEIAKQHRAYWLGCEPETDGGHDNAGGLFSENHLQGTGLPHSTFYHTIAVLKGGSYGRCCPI